MRDFVKLPEDECCICGERERLRSISAYAREWGGPPQWVGRIQVCPTHDGPEWIRVGEMLINGEARKGASDVV